MFPGDFSDERASSTELQHHAKDSNARIHNWAVLMGNILCYYQVNNPHGTGILLRALINHVPCSPLYFVGESPTYFRCLCPKD